MLVSWGNVVIYTVHWPVQLIYTVCDWVHIQWQSCSGQLVLCDPWYTNSLVVIFQLLAPPLRTWAWISFLHYWYVHWVFHTNSGPLITCTTDTNKLVQIGCVFIFSPLLRKVVLPLLETRKMTGRVFIIILSPLSFPLSLLFYWLGTCLVLLSKWLIPLISK